MDVDIKVAVKGVAMIALAFFGFEFDSVLCGIGAVLLFLDLTD